MTVDDFWKVMAHVDRDLLQRGEGYDEAAIRPLVDVLTLLEKAELRSFQDHLAQALYDLDGRPYFDASIDAAGSDDSFLYVRCFVVAMGRDVYQRTLRDPGLMPKTVDHWCERLLYVARSAWRQKTGEEVDFDTKVSFESGSNASLWPPESERQWPGPEDAKRWRREAQTMRAQAAKTEDPVCKRDMLQLAENCERIAERLEKEMQDKPR